MKRHNYLYELIKDKDNLRLAHKNARRGKNHYSEVKEVDANLDEYIDRLYEMLDSMTYIPSEYDMFTKMDKGKIREIYKLPYFPDRIIHHAILQVLEPIWKKVLVNQTYQSIKGRGTQKCKRDLEAKLNKLDYSETWCTKIDVEKFYPSVKNVILKVIIRKKIKCKFTLELLDKLIDSMEGLPIGNYISQYLGNLYLAYMDHYILSLPHVVAYSRYCDDIVGITKNKKDAKNVLDILRMYLQGNLKLKIKYNEQYFLISCRGIDFVGFVFWTNGVRLRKSIATSFKRASKVNKQEVLSSYYGWVKECKAERLWNKYYIGDKEYAGFN